jgi:hypothetical protein
VPKERGFIYNLHAPDHLTALMDLKDSLYHIINMTLGIDPARNGRSRLARLQYRSMCSV